MQRVSPNCRSVHAEQIPLEVLEELRGRPSRDFPGHEERIAAHAERVQRWAAEHPGYEVFGRQSREP